MKLFNLITSIIISLLVGLCLFFILRSYYIPKIGYVKLGVLMEKYSGILEASKRFDADYKQAQANLDTLRYRFSVFRNSKPSQESLKQAEQEYYQYQRRVSEEMEKRRNELSKPEVEKINSYISDYGKKHNYRIILGATLDGNILYAKDDDDLTQTILKDLNDIYQKKYKE